MKRLCLGVLCGFVACASGAGTIPDNQAVSAIVGESSNQNFSVMLAVACAIRNRGTLQGVYGLTNLVVKRAPHKVRERATRAWLASAGRDVTGGCKYFGCPADKDYFLHVLHFHPVKTVGLITFYKP
jgi:hypothetical protein